MNKLKLFSVLACAFALSVVGWAQSFPPAWNYAAHYSPGDRVQLGGNVFRCIYPVTRFSPTTAYGYWELAEVHGNTSLSIGIGKTFPTLTAAWKYALNATIAGSSQLTFNIVTANGAYVQTLDVSGFSLDHPFGAQISIVGDSKVGIEFFVPTASKGFYLDSGHTIASLSNLQIVGSNLTQNGITASGNATIGRVSNCYVNGFQTCIAAQDGASITLDQFVTFSGNVIPVWVIAVSAQTGGRVHLSGTTIDGTGNSNNSYAGLVADTHGRIDAPGCTIKGCSYGAQATDNGDVNISGCTIKDGGYGIYADRHGYIEADGLAFTNTLGQPSIYCYHDSHVVIIGHVSSVMVNTNKADGSVVDIQL